MKYAMPTITHISKLIVSKLGIILHVSNFVNIVKHQKILNKHAEINGMTLLI